VSVQCLKEDSSLLSAVGENDERSDSIRMVLYNDVCQHQRTISFSSTVNLRRNRLSSRSVIAERIWMDTRQFDLSRDEVMCWSLIVGSMYMCAYDKHIPLLESDDADAIDNGLYPSGDASTLLTNRHYPKCTPDLILNRREYGYIFVRMRIWDGR
jgi:hypothetical protein